ncbi:hypothetical protein A9Z61_04100 [Moraxella osloensis]|nr:phage tail protein [Moraxella osloensis]OBX58514.1 hypothetical protein A9Z61_04100 [Moraxella osloensis]
MSFLSKLLGGGKTRQPKIEKDSLASISTAKILYGLAEGEISGLVDGAKSIKLDDTPLLNDAGQPNFVDDKEKLAVKWDFRSGSNNQDYIQGFPDVANEKSVGVQLRQATPYVKQINDINLSAIVVRVSFGALRNQKTNGDITGTTVKYRIDLMTDNGSYQAVIDGNVTAKTSAKYERSHRIDLPKAKNGWLVKVTRITPDSTSDLLSNSMSIEAITEIIDVKLAYPNTAMLGIQYDARTFSNIAKLAVRCRGKLLSIPSNYDPVGRTYNGIWDGTFKTAYSNNPAWVFYDICLNWRYGLGRRLDASMIDKWALYQIARYCDEMVSDGLGGQEPRFAVNVYLQSQQDAFTVLQSLSSIFRGMAYWNGEQVTVAMDAPQTPVYTFSRANVVDGIFNYTGTRARDRHTVAKVAWDNPKNDFKTEYEFVRDEYAIAKYGINQLDINMMGCTSQGQAQRAGLWALKSEQLESRQVSFSIGLDGMLERIKPSAIIAISDEVFAGRANGGRIVAISGDKKTITLDRAVTANVGDTLVINNSDGVAERQSISAINGADITVSVAFDKPEAQHIWAIDSPNLRLMLFKIISIKQNDDLTHTITAIQHEPQKYAAVDSGAYVQPQRVSVVEPNIVAAPEAVAIGQFERQIQGQTVVTMTIGWTQVKDAVSYIVEFKRDDGNWVKLAPQSGLSVDVEGVYAGNYLARVTAVNAYDLQSMPKTSMLTAVVGKLGTPPSLASLKATGILFGMQLDWLFAQGSSDTNYTEIQVASAPDTNVALLGTYAYPTNTATINGLQGNLTQYYRGRIVDKLGNVSPWTNWVKGVTSADAQKVLDLLNGQITESQLYKDLGAKIEKIGTIENGLSNEITDRTNAVKSINDALSAEVQNRLNAIKSTNEAINKEITERQAAITAEITERQAAVKNVNDALSAEVQNRLNADNVIQNNISQTNNDIAKEVTDRKKAIGDTQTLIQNEAQSRIDGDTINTRRIDGVYAQVNPAMAGDSGMAGDDTVFVGVWSEQSARIENDTALGQRIDVLSASVNNNAATIYTNNQVLVDADKALASRIDNLNTDYQSNKATINMQLKTLSDASSSQASSINTLQSSVSTAQSTADTAVRKANAAQGTADDAVSKAVANSALIQSEQQTRADNDSALSQRIDSVVATAGDNKALIVSEQTARADADGALGKRIDTVVAKTDNNTSAIVSEQNARTSADNALSSRIDTVSAATSSNTALIQSEQQARADGDSVNAQRIDGVYAQINPQLAGSSNDLAGNDTIFAGVWSEQSARIEGDTALGIRIDNVSSNWGNSLAAIQTENKTQADQLTALAQRVDIIQAAQGGNISLIMDNYYTKAQSDTVIANGIEKFKADYVNPQLNLKASAQALSETQTQVTNINDKLNIASSKLDGVFAQVNPPLAGSDSELAGNDSILVGVWSEISARIEDDTALGQRIDALNVSMNGNTAAISTLNTAMINADSALSQRIDSLNSDYQGNKASVTSQLSTLSNATSSQASSISGLQASVNTAQSTANTAVNKADNAQSAANTANTAVQSEQKARADADGVLGKRIDTVIAKADSNAAAIATEQTARANADGALSSRIDTVQSTVGNNTASIQTQQKSIDGLNTQYTVKIDVNGRVSGFGLASSNTQSDFAIRADKFYIAPPEGTGKGDSPFMVLTSSQTINGTVVPAGTYIKSAYIHDGSIDVAKIADATITSAKIGQGEIKTANIDNAAITTAKIGTAQVDTLQIAGEAVVVPRAQYNPNSVKIPANGQHVLLHTVSMETTGNAISISIGFDSISGFIEGTITGDITSNIKLTRDGIIIREVTLNAAKSVEENSSYGDAWLNFNFLNIPAFLDIPPAGNHSYKLYVSWGGQGKFDPTFNSLYVYGSSIQLLGVKR